MGTKVLIVDDHPLFLAGLRSIIESDKDIILVGEANDGEEAIKIVKENLVDVVIMDITMPNLNGIDATKQILAISPNIKVLALSIHSGKRFVKEMLNAGAVGYLLKDSATDELLTAIKKVTKGDMYLSSAITSIALNRGKKEDETEDLEILNTKLHRPPVSIDYVIRATIIKQLEKNIDKPLSIVSAPAGYGKSISVSQWLEQTSVLHTWLSLDEEHNDLRVFLTYLKAAIDKIFPGSLEKTGELLNASNLPPLSALSTTLINELDFIKQEFILVLDDYYMIHEKAIHQLMNLLLQYPPEHMHISILTRFDPPLKINKLLTHDRLTMVRMNELCFTELEIVELFKKLLNVDLSSETTKSILEKTEGWIVGLRLASLTVDDPCNIDRVLKNIKGDLSLVSEYLVAELLSKQTPELQDSLIESSILNRFSLELLDEIFTSKTSEEKKKIKGDDFIQTLIKSNMFVIPLDDKHEWFRYHHLFQELLQNQLRKRMTKEQIKEIYSKASIWFEKNDFIAEAIEYAMKAGDTDWAVKIVVAHWEDTIDKDLWYTVEGWMNLLPEKVIVKSVSLLLARMWITMQRLRMEDIPALIELIEQNSGDLTDTETGYLAYAKSAISYFMGDTQKALDYSEQALQLIPKKYFTMRGDISGWRIVELQTSGQGDRGVEIAKEEIKYIYPPDDHRQLTHLVMPPNFVYIIDANLPALRTGIESFFKVPNISPYILGFGLYFRACICWWGNDLEGAVQKFDNSIKIRFQTINRLGIDSYICTALALQEMNRQQDVADVMNRATQFAMELDDPVIQSILASGQARLNLKQGNLKAAEKWLNSAEHSGIDPSMMYWLEIPAITCCRVLIAIGSANSLQEALNLLKGYREYSESVFNTLRTIETTVLQALTYFKLQHENDASDTLKYALELAADREWIRPFVEVGNDLDKRGNTITGSILVEQMTIAGE